MNNNFIDPNKIAFENKNDSPSDMVTPVNRFSSHIGL